MSGFESYSNTWTRAEQPAGVKEQVGKVKQFKNILVIGPFSRQLLECASSLLNTSQSKMTLMSFLPAVEKVEVATREGNSIDVESLIVTHVVF